MTKDRITLGKFGEQAAVKFLKKQKYRIVDCNFRVKQGEIDIIAKEKGTLVFIEVKTRSGIGFGFPSESVTFRKRRQIARAAQAYLSLNNLHNSPARFDVVSVLLDNKGQPEIELIRNAFELE